MPSQAERTLNLANLAPDHEYGFTENFLGTVLSWNEMQDFKGFMNGQGIALHNDRPVYFATDFERWVKG